MLLVYIQRLRQLRIISAVSTMTASSSMARRRVIGNCLTRGVRNKLKKKKERKKNVRFKKGTTRSRLRVVQTRIYRDKRAITSVACARSQVDDRSRPGRSPQVVSRSIPELGEESPAGRKAITIARIPLRERKSVPRVI